MSARICSDTMPLSLRIDPWNPAYESALHLEEDEAIVPASVDPFVESDQWAPVAPEPASRPDTIVFVDGVQRVETRLIGEDDGRVLYGAFSSIAVGAVLAQSPAPQVSPGLPRRVLALTGGASVDPIEIPCGSRVLSFAVQSTSATGLNGVHEAVNVARREAETQLGQQMVQQGYPLVIVDGGLTFQPTRHSMAVGLVKTIHRRYLEGAPLAVLAQLAPRTRTPLFRISRDRPLYSWYLRLSEARAIEHPWAGLVRLETLDSIGLHQAGRLADVTALHLPSFASSRMRDPRAPQNVYPIGALEDRLRRQLGDQDWIRRHIEAYFHGQGAAA